MMGRLLFLSLLVLGLAASASADGRWHRCGDVNRDGRQDVLDVVTTLRAVVGVQTIVDSDDHDTADLAPFEDVESWNGARVVRNPGNGAIDVADVVAALRLAVGLDLLNDCAPLPVVSTVRPWAVSCADGTALASLRGRRLVPDTGAPLVTVRGVPAVVERWESGPSEDAVWFHVPVLDLAAFTERVDVRLLSTAGPVTSFGELEVKESCGYESESAFHLSQGFGFWNRDSAAEIYLDGAQCLRSARLVGQRSGRVVPLDLLDPLEDARVGVTIPAQVAPDQDVYDLFVETPCATHFKDEVWEWIGPDAPDVTSVSPDVVPAAGGVELRVRGTHLDNMSDLVVGDRGVSVRDGSLVIQSPEEAIVRSAPAAIVQSTTHQAFIRAMNRGQVDSTDVPFTYVGSGTPECLSFTPASGPVGGGTEVTVTGSALGAVTAVNVPGGHPQVGTFERPDPTRSIRLRMPPVSQPFATQIRLGYDGSRWEDCPTLFTYTP